MAWKIVKRPLVHRVIYIIKPLLRFQGWHFVAQTLLAAAAGANRENVKLHPEQRNCQVTNLEQSKQITIQESADFETNW